MNIANAGSEEDEDRKRPATMTKGENDNVSEAESEACAELLERTVATSPPLKKPSVASAGTKGKVARKGAGGARKEKGMPSRPLSAYNLYFREARLHLMSESPRFQGQERSNNPGLFAELGKAIAERWKSISEEELSKYKKLAALDMERYSREMSEYRLKRAKFRLREETAAAAASEDPAGGDRGGREGEATTSLSLMNRDSVVAGEGRPPAPPALSAFIDSSLLRTNALLQSLQRTSDLVAPAPDHHRFELTRPSSSSNYHHGLSPPRNASVVSELSSLLSPTPQRQEMDGYAIAQALRIQQLEGIIARQDQQRLLHQRHNSFDWQLAAGALDRDRLARADVHAGAASALAAAAAAAAALPGSPVPSSGAPDAASASGWGGHHPRELSRMLGAPNSDLFPSFFGLASAQQQRSPPRSADLDDPATTRALLGQLLSQRSQQAQNEQLLLLLRQQQQQQQQQQQHWPPQQPTLDPATRRMLLQRLMSQRTPDRKNGTTDGDGSNDNSRGTR
jgi:HMG (high mobility group) box